jgi:hypothetical protein
MSCIDRRDFCVSLGETFHPIIRWGSGVLTSKAITGISQAAGAVVTAVGHGAPDGWPVAVVSAKGMTQINATRYPPQGNDWEKSTLLTADTLMLNDVNSADFSAYTSGGFLVYDTPVNLTGMTAVLTIWDNPGETGTPLATLTELSGITINNTLKTIAPVLATVGLTWTTGYYDLMMTDSGGISTLILTGSITIEA